MYFHSFPQASFPPFYSPIHLPYISKLCYFIRTPERMEYVQTLRTRAMLLSFTRCWSSSLSDINAHICDFKWFLTPCLFDIWAANMSRFFVVSSSTFICPEETTSINGVGGVFVTSSHPGVFLDFQCTFCLRRRFFASRNKISNLLRHISSLLMMPWSLLWGTL